MKRAVIKCVVQKVLGVQDVQHPEQKGSPKKAPKAAWSKVEPESVSDRDSTPSRESSAAHRDIFFIDEEEKGDSVERAKLTVFARQHVERVGPGSGRTGHPRLELEAPSSLRKAALWGFRAELLPLGPRSAAPFQRCRFQCS